MINRLTERLYKTMCQLKDFTEVGSISSIPNKILVQASDKKLYTVEIKYVGESTGDMFNDLDILKEMK